MDRSRRYGLWCIVVFFFTLCGCSHHFEVSDKGISKIYTAGPEKDDLVTRFTPRFMVYDHQNDYNRIGRPSAGVDAHGKERFYIDTDHPAIYYMVRQFSTGKGSYTNYIYRVHFPKVPFSIIPFYLTAGKNVGLMVVVTVDANHRPVLVTTVNTCGCYTAILPTSHLPRDAFPKSWKEGPLNVYGETLPGILEYNQTNRPSILVHMRPDVHRVMNMEIVEASDSYKSRASEFVISQLIPMANLDKIPINGGTTSFYYQKGRLKGHVKGAVKLWESIFMSLISLDVFVGTDKAYADTQVTENPFYTSLKPWNRSASDMWNFDDFLVFWGWRL